MHRIRKHGEGKLSAGSKNFCLIDLNLDFASRKARVHILGTAARNCAVNSQNGFLRKMCKLFHAFRAGSDNELNDAMMVP